jgi:uncharacterized protein (DUF58 family)
VAARRRERRRPLSFFMAPLEHGGLRRLDDLYRALLPPSGRALLTGGLVPCAVLLLGGIQRQLVVLFAIALASLAAAALAGLFFLPRVSAVRRLGPAPAAGAVISYRVRVTNLGRSVLRGLVVQERGLPFEVRPAGEPGRIDRLAPGESAEVVLQLACNERGVYDLDRLQVASLFPSGLLHWPRITRRCDRLWVLPRPLVPEALPLPPGRKDQPGGLPNASRVGDSTEFLGTRDFRQGDRVRDLHWPSLARTGRLVVKEFQQEFFTRIALVVDVEVPRRGFFHDPRGKQGTLTLLERSLSLGAGIAAGLANADAVVDVLAAGDEVQRVQAGRALGEEQGVLELLAAVDGARKFAPEVLLAALGPELLRLSAVVLVLVRWDGAREQVVRRLREAGLPVRVVMASGAAPAQLEPGELVAWGEAVA